MKDKPQLCKDVTGQILALLIKNDEDPDVNLAGLTVACCVLAHSMDVTQERLASALDSAWKFVEVTSKRGSVQ